MFVEHYNDTGDGSEMFSFDGSEMDWVNELMKALDAGQSSPDEGGEERAEALDASAGVDAEPEVNVVVSPSQWANSLKEAIDVFALRDDVSSTGSVGHPNLSLVQDNGKAAWILLVCVVAVSSFDLFASCSHVCVRLSFDQVCIVHWVKESAVVPPVKVSVSGKITSGVGWLVRLDYFNRPIWPTYLCDTRVDFRSPEVSASSCLVHANLRIRIIGKKHEQDPIPEWVFSLQRVWSDFMEAAVACDDKCFVCGGGAVEYELHACALCRLCSHERCAQRCAQRWADYISEVASQSSHRCFISACPAPDRVCLVCKAALE